jgi:hypothetical protein
MAERTENTPNIQGLSFANPIRLGGAAQRIPPIQSDSSPPLYSGAEIRYITNQSEKSNLFGFLAI